MSGADGGVSWSDEAYSASEVEALWRAEAVDPSTCQRYASQFVQSPHPSASLATLTGNLHTTAVLADYTAVAEK